MTKKWWHDKIAYQIYPKSFMDTNGDGIGDLCGVISRLDYLKQLGIDIIWLSPIYKSPFVDQGYDIADYYAIAEEFGTMEDFDELLAEAKRRDMYIIMDLVVNHCSDQHEWFQKALKDPYGKYADYFYFRQGHDGQAPTNYRAYFGGPAWEPVLGTDLYYLHSFAKEQPDLNWENEELRSEIYKMVNWWQDKGVAGFRIDAIINIKKNQDFPAFPVDDIDGLTDLSQMVSSADGIDELLQNLKHNTFDSYDAFTVAEVFNMKEGEMPQFIGENGNFSTMFDFSGEVLGLGEHGWYDAPEVAFTDWRDLLLKNLKAAEGIGFYANIIENHDEPRGASRYLPSYLHNAAGTKMLGTVSVLLRGIPFIFQGQEIGMSNCRRSSISEYDDISTHDEYVQALQHGFSEKEALEICGQRSRDNSRTPMQWSAEPHGGFTAGVPWLKENDNYKEINVAAQEQDPDSVLNYYRQLIALRKSKAYKELFTYGTCTQIYPEQTTLFAYERELNTQKVIVLANFGEHALTLPVKAAKRELLLSNLPDGVRFKEHEVILASGAAAVYSC